MWCGRRSGQTLGQLRNASVDAALGEFIVRWDDAITRNGVIANDGDSPGGLVIFVFCATSSSIRHGRGVARIWNREAYPMGFVQEVCSDVGA